MPNRLANSAVRFDRPDLNYPDTNILGVSMETETMLSVSRDEWNDSGMMFERLGTGYRAPWIATGKLCFEECEVPFAVYTFDEEPDMSYLISTENMEDFSRNMDAVLNELVRADCIKPSNILGRSGTVTNRDVWMSLRG